MNTITTTDLRTKSSDLVTFLKKGNSVSLIHRSKIVGKIIPSRDVVLKTIDAKELQNKIDRLDFPSLTPAEMDRRYRIAMMKKHGKRIR